MAAIETVLGVRNAIAPYVDTLDARARAQTPNAINTRAIDNARALLDDALTEASHINIGRARNQLLDVVRLLDEAGDTEAAQVKVAIAVHALDHYIGER